MVRRAPSGRQLLPVSQPVSPSVSRAVSPPAGRAARGRALARQRRPARGWCPARGWHVALGCCIALALGCRSGALYQHTIEPLTTDFDRTPIVAGEPARASVKRFRYSSYVDVSWDDNAIGRIAKDAGLAQIYYADLEILSILGIWTQTWIRVYGVPVAQVDERTGSADRARTTPR